MPGQGESSPGANEIKPTTEKSGGLRAVFNSARKALRINRTQPSTEPVGWDRMKLLTPEEQVRVEATFGETNPNESYPTKAERFEDIIDQVLAERNPQNKKGFIGPLVVIAGLISIAGLIGLGIYIGKKSTAPSATNPVITQSEASPSPSPDETANWKTYTNTTYGYSLKYPADILIEDTDLCGNKYSSPSQVRFLFLNNTKSICLPDTPATLSITSPKSAPTPISYSDSCISTQKEHIVIDGIQAEKYTATKDVQCAKEKVPQGISQLFGIKGVQIYLERDNQTLAIFYTMSSTDSPLYIPVPEEKINQILSTFKFTQ